VSRSVYRKLHRRFGPKLSGQERHEKTRQKIEAALTQLPVLSHIEARRRLGTPAPPTGKTVAIVGAGFAGLSAAYTLANLGFGVTVFEANDRVGGRVWSWIDTAFVPGRIIEAGAELIGANHPLWLIFARTFGLGMSVLTSEDNYSQLGLEIPMYVNGKHPTAEQAQEAYGLMTKVIEKVNEDAKKIPDPLQPWLTPGAAQLDKTRVSDQVHKYIDEVVADPDKRAFVFALFKVDLENNQTVTLDEQSYLALLSQIQGGGGPDYWTETEVFRCENGNDSLAKAFQDAIGKDNVRLNTRVTRIEVTDTKVNITATLSETYDYVVLAVPPSRWGSIEIRPSIDRGMLMQMGPAIKYLTPLSSRFWISKTLVPSLAPSGVDDQLGLTWEATDNQAVAYSDGAPLNPNFVLSVFAGANAASAAHDAKNIDDYMKDRIGKLYPGYSSWIAKKPEFVDWVDRAGNGYSCPAPGQVTTVGPFLNEPWQKRLFFAGEHTSMAFFGYMEGALQAGVRAASAMVAADSGVSFDDTPMARQAGSLVSEMVIRSGDVLDAIQVTNGRVAMPQHGGTGGGAALLRVEAGDRIVEVSGYTGTWFGWNCVLQLMLKSEAGRSYGPYGDMTHATRKDWFSYASPGQALLAFRGRTNRVPLANGATTTIIASLEPVFA